MRSKWWRSSLWHGKLRRTFPENLLKIVLFHRGTNKLKSISLIQLDVFSEDILFSLPHMQAVRSMQLLSRDLEETLIIVECYHVSIYFCFILCFTLLPRIPIQTLAEKHWPCVAWDWFWLRRKDIFRLFWNNFEEFSHPVPTGTSFSTF